MMRKSLSSLVVGALVAVIVLANASSASAAPITSTFQLVGTTICLDGYVGHYPDDVYATGCNGGNFQRWIWGGHTGETKLESVAVRGKCQQRAGNAVDLVTCHATAPIQRWQMLVSSTYVVRIKKVGTGSPGLCIVRTGPDDVGLRGCDDSSYQRYWDRRLP